MYLISGANLQEALDKERLTNGIPWFNYFLLDNDGNTLAFAWPLDLNTEIRDFQFQNQGYVVSRTFTGLESLISTACKKLSGRAIATVIYNNEEYAIPLKGIRWSYFYSNLIREELHIVIRYQGIKLHSYKSNEQDLDLLALAVNCDAGVPIEVTLDDINTLFSQFTLQTESEHEMLQMLKPDIRQLTNESLNSGFNLLKDRIMYFPLSSEPRNADYYFNEGIPFKAVVNKLVDTRRAELRAERNRIMSILPFNLLENALCLNNSLDFSWQDRNIGMPFVKAAKDLGCEPSALLFSFSQLIYYKKIITETDSNSENFMRINLTALLLDFLLPRGDLLCYREINDKYTLFSRDVQKIVDAVVQKFGENTNFPEIIVEEKRELIQSNLKEAVTLAEYANREADLVKIARLSKLDANRYNDVESLMPLSRMKFEDEVGKHRHSSRVSHAALIWGSSNAGYSLLLQEFIEDSFSVLIELCHEKVFREDSSTSKSAYLAIVDFLSFIKIAMRKDSSLRIEVEGPKLGDPKPTPAKLKKEKPPPESDKSRSPTRRLGSTQVRFTLTEIPREAPEFEVDELDKYDLLQEIAFDSTGAYATVILAKRKGLDKSCVLRRKIMTEQMEMRQLRIFAEVAKVPHSLSLLSFFKEESNFSQYNRGLLVTVHPLLVPIYNRYNREPCYIRKLTIDDAISVLIAGLEFLDGLYHLGYVHLDINPANVMIKPQVDTPILPDDVVFIDYDTMRSISYDGPIRTICGVFGFTHPAIENSLGESNYSHYPTGMEDVFSLSRVVQHILLGIAKDSGKSHEYSGLLYVLLEDMENVNIDPDFDSLLYRAKNLQDKGLAS